MSDERRATYFGATARMLVALRDALARGSRPQFRLPAESLIAPLDAAAAAIAVNPDAFELVAELMRAAAGDATVEQLRACLKVADVPYRTATIAELGLRVAPLVPGGSS
jgi:hypothetical protein